MVASTEVSAMRSGIPAATSAPKVIARMIRVTGIDSSPAFFRSFSTAVLSSFSVLASPNSAT